MLHILLMIVKIIGIIFLTILGLFFGTLLLVLLVPVRYSMEGSYHGELKGYGKVNWLLHMISFKLTYDKEVNVSVRLFGIRLYPRRKKKSKKKNRKASVRAEELLSIQEVPSEEDTLIEETISEEISIDQEPVKYGEAKDGAAEQKAVKEEKSTGIFHKIAAFFEKLKGLKKTWIKKYKSLKITIEKAKAFILDEENKKTFFLILRQVRKLLGHVLPGTIKGQITFGMEDPYTTGQILSFAGILYPLYNKKLKITPVFDQVVLDGELYLKGRIRLITMMMLTARVYFNKNFRMLLKRWMG